MKTERKVVNLKFKRDQAGIIKRLSDDGWRLCAIVDFKAYLAREKRGFNGSE